MKKRVRVALVLSFLACLLLSLNTAFAISDTYSLAKGQLNLDFGLAEVSGNTYLLWGDLTANTPETLSISVTLYRKVGNNLEWVAGLSDRETNTTQLGVDQRVTLIPGNTYVVYGSGSGNTQSPSGSKTYYS